MANKSFEVLFKINAALSEQFGDALKSAQNAMKGMAGVSKYTSGVMSKNMQNLQGQYADLNKIAVQMQKYRNLQNSLNNTRAAFDKAKLDSRAAQQNYLEQSQQLRDMQKAYKQMQTFYKDNKRSMSADDRAFYQAQLQQAQQEIKSQKLTQREAGQAVDKQSAAMQRLQSQLGGQQAALNAAKAALQSAGISAQTFAQEEARLRAEIERTNQAIERQGQIDSRRQRFNQAGENLSNSHNEFQAATDTAKSIMSPITSAIDEAVSYEKEFSKLKALTQTQNIRAGDFETVNKEMAGLDTTIKHLGATTEFTNTEVLGAANKFAMSGWSPEQIKNTLPGLIDVATASGEKDLVKLGDYMSDELQALGLTKGTPQEVAKNISHYADLMTYGMNQSNNDLESFHQAMKYFAPVGTQLGMSPEEMVGAVMTQADAGIKGSMGGTAMRMASLRMFAPPKAATKALQEMGELSSDAQKSLAEASAEWAKLGVSEDAGWLERMRALKEASKTMSKSDFMAKLSKITGVNAVSGNAALLADFDKFEERLNMMQNGGVDNWAKDVAKTMRDNTQTDFDLFNSAVSGLSVTVGDMFLPVVRQATQAATQFVGGLDKFAQANPGIVQGVASIAAGLSGLIVASAGAKVAMAGFEYVSSGFGVLKDMVTGLGTKLLSVFNMIRGISFAGMFAGLQAQITAITAAVTGLPARIMTAFTALRGMSLASMFAGLASMAGPILIAVAAAAALAGAAYMIINNWSAISPILSGIGNTLMTSLQTAFSAIQPAISSLISSVQRLMPAFAIIGTGLVGGLLIAINAAANLFSGLVGMVANIAAAIVNVFSGIGNIIASVLAGDLSGAFNHLVDMAKSVGTNIAEALIAPLRGIKDTVTGFFDPAISFIKGIKGNSASGSSGGGSFETPASVPAETSTVQAQSVQVQAAQVEQSQSSDVFAGVQEQVAQITNSFSNIGTSTESVSTNLTNLGTATEGIATNIQPMNEGFAQMSASIQPVAEGFTNLSSSIQPVGESFTQLSSSIPTVAEGFNQINAGVTTFNSELTNTGSQLQAANSAVQAFSSSLTATNGAITGFTGALTGSVGAVTGLGSAASGASGAISGLGSAASAACAALANAGAQAAAAVSAAAASIPTGKVAANYRGGIYPKGEFMTTFAEKSAEAAIPLDKSSRAVSLWQQVGQILGLLPGESNISYDSPPRNNFDPTDIIKTFKSARDKQIENYNSEMKSIVSTQNNSTSIFSKSTGGGIFEDIREAFTGGNILENLATVFSDNIGGNNTGGNILGDIGEIFTSTTGNSGGILDNIGEIFTSTVPVQNNNSIFSKPAGGGIFESIGELFTGGNILESAGALLADNLLPAQSSVDNGFNITFEVNIAGNASAEEVQQGIQQAIPSVEDFAQRLAEYRHEQQRASFA